MQKLTASARLNSDDNAGLRTLDAHAAQLARVYPHWYGVGPGGQPRRDAGNEARAALSAQAQAVGMPLWARAVHPDGAPLRLLLLDNATRRAHVARLAELAREDGAQGLLLELGQPGPGAAEAYPMLALELAGEIHGEGLKLGLAVHLSAEHPIGPKSLEALAQPCELVQLLGSAFDAPRKPGPVADAATMERELALAVGAVGAAKLEWVLPAHGWHFGSLGLPRRLDWAAWEPLVKAHAPERRDPASAEMTLSWGKETVWMNDAISLTAKLWAARRQGVHQVCVDGLGGEDPRLWALLDTLPAEFVG